MHKIPNFLAEEEEEKEEDQSILQKQFTYICKQRKNKKTPSKRDTHFYLKMTVTTIIVGLYGQ